MLRKMTMHLSVILVLSGAQNLVAAQICSPNNDTECPTSSSSQHVFDTLVVFGNPLNMGADNKILLGTSSTGVLRACVEICSPNCAWAATPLNDPEHAGADYGLQGNSTFCAGAGADQITVVQSNTSCGGETIYPMDFNGYSLSILGHQGNDDLHAGYQGTVHLCGGPDIDELSGSYSGGSQDGWTGRDRLYTSGMVSGAFEQWGHDGNDVIISYANSFFTNSIWAEGEAHADCILLYYYDTTTLYCGDGSDQTNVSPRPPDCETTVSSCSWTSN